MKEELRERLVKIYGYGHEAVLQFDKLAESPNFPDELLEVIVNAHEMLPILDSFEALKD